MKTGVFKWSKDYDAAQLKYGEAAKMFKELDEDQLAADAYLQYALCSEKLKIWINAGDGYAEAARLLPDAQWEKSMQYFTKADFNYKMAGSLDRGFTLKKRFAANLCDSDDAQSVKNGI